MKIARLFSGFDGAGEGIRDAGFDLTWAIESDDHNCIGVDWGEE